MSEVRSNVIAAGCRPRRPGSRAIVQIQSSACANVLASLPDGAGSDLRWGSSRQVRLHNRAAGIQRACCQSARLSDPAGNVQLSGGGGRR
jgi:hypothetical protein